MVGRQSQAQARKNAIVVTKAFAANPYPSVILRRAAIGVDGKSRLKTSATDSGIYAELIADPTVRRHVLRVSTKLQLVLHSRGVAAFGRMDLDIAVLRQTNF